MTAENIVESFGKHGKIEVVKIGENTMANDLKLFELQLRS